MINDWEKFQEGYTQAEDSVKLIVDSNLIPTTVSDMCSRNKLSKELRNKIVTAYAYKVLGLISNPELHSYVSEITTLDKNKISEELSLLDSTIKKSNDEGSRLNLEIKEADVKLDELPTPPPTPHLSPIRTMDSDSKQVGYSSNEEATYTSAQSALINESK